ncbi:unnamed protein product [Cladocopium goreaui]|uniref:Ras-related GTP-binding protein A (Rag A) (RagA) n=1 Tax=Cladocopium goreaui TaxID=2562237 RepID=A0A9P1D4W8_9DINO|nr:unnamed protein product [Cladocopium goreaui]
MATSTNGFKVLLMGRAGAGKTSMKSIIFANYHSRDTKMLQPTNHVEHNSLRFLGNLKLNLWDCGGQDQFMENYFESQRENIFQHCEVLIYVLVAARDKSLGNEERKKDVEYFKAAIESLSQHSPNATTFVLIHKLDLVHESKRSEVYRQVKEELLTVAPQHTQKRITFMGTSIWDDTLFKAWSRIVAVLVPDPELLQDQVNFMCQQLMADEVVIFEKNTFLVITRAHTKEMQDQYRFEKLSNIIKQYKLSCQKAKTNFRNFVVKNDSFRAIIEPFLTHSYIMVVISDLSITSAATSANLWAARAYFSDMVKADIAMVTWRRNGLKYSCRGHVAQRLWRPLWEVSAVQLAMALGQLQQLGAGSPMVSPWPYGMPQMSPMTPMAPPPAAPYAAPGPAPMWWPGERSAVSSPGANVNGVNGVNAAVRKGGGPKKRNPEAPIGAADSHSGDTLRMHLRSLLQVDSSRVLIVRKINRLGFASPQILREHFSWYGTVENVLVAHSRVKSGGGQAGIVSRLRPSGLGFVVMSKGEEALKILAEGPEQQVSGTIIRVQKFERRMSESPAGLEELEAKEQEQEPCSESRAMGG